MNPIIEGLTILAKYYPDDDFAAAHDQIWYGLYEPDKSGEGDLTKLKELRWFESRDCWSHFC